MAKYNGEKLEKTQEKKPGQIKMSQSKNQNSVYHRGQSIL